MIPQKIRNHALYPLLLSLSGALLLWLAWPTKPFSFLVFIGFVPFIELVNYYFEKKKANDLVRFREKLPKRWFKKENWSLFGYLYIGFLSWNLLTTWWVWIADPTGAVMAFTLNSFFMTLPFMAFSYVRKGLKGEVASLSLISFWIGFEYLHLNWDLSWPWLTIGNVFASTPFWVQWYEYTGILGGSVWVLLINILFYRFLYKKGSPFVNAISAVGLLLVAFLIPTTNLDELDETRPLNVVVAQPNIDPYHKFKEEFYIKNLHDIMTLSETEMVDSTSYVFWPETAVQGWVRESKIDENEAIILLTSFVKKHPSVTLITGIESYEMVDSVNKKPSTKYKEGMGFYETYNTGLMLAIDSTLCYHKSKLVPGAEIIPFQGVVSVIIEQMNFPQMGNYTKSDSAIVFKDAMPLICYESIYGDYVRKFVQKGAGFIAIITNDAWWGDTDGHRQHFMYARLRAIEMRKYAVQCANTGLSGVIDPRGKVLKKTNFDELAAFNYTIETNLVKTFYSTYGDYIGRVASFLAVTLLLSGIVKRKAKYTRP